MAQLREPIDFKNDSPPQIAMLMAEDDKVATGIVVNLFELVRDTDKVIRAFRCLNCMNIRGFQIFLWYRYIHDTYDAKSIDEILDTTLKLNISQQKKLAAYINQKVPPNYPYTAHIGIAVVR